MMIGRSRNGAGIVVPELQRFYGRVPLYYRRQRNVNEFVVP
jgi:hypothetical protein